MAVPRAQTGGRGTGGTGRRGRAARTTVMMAVPRAQTGGDGWRRVRGWTATGAMTGGDECTDGRRRAVLRARTDVAGRHPGGFEARRRR